MKYVRMIALMMVFVMALPGCSAYNKTPVSSVVNTNDEVKTFNYQK